jgi:hypothetical protein
MPDAGFVFSGEETPNWGNGRRAGVAQSVAQLSCKQQVRGSSPLASSLTRANILTPSRPSPAPQIPHTPPMPTPKGSASPAWM